MGPERGEKSVSIPLDRCLDLWRPWRKALRIKLLGKTVSYKLLSQRISDLWRAEGRLEITDLEDGFYIVRFTRESDYEVALMNGPWVIQGHYLHVTKWRPFFEPSNEAIRTTLAWIRFPRLPIWCFKVDILTELGNLIGKTVKIDMFTKENIRARYARVCVEIQLERALDSTVILNGRNFKVEYEGLKMICFGCGKFGHSKENCPAHVPEGATQEPTGASTGTAPNVQQKGPTKENPYGPWMIATTRRRWNPNRANGSQQRSNNRQPEGEKNSAPAQTYPF